MQPTATDSLAQANLQTTQDAVQPINPFNNTAPGSGGSANLGQAQQLINSINTAQPQAQQPTHQPSLLERLLPTFGGILGGLGGAALGVGTGGLGFLVDPSLAAVGGGLGKAAENALTGQKVLQGNDITQGLEQGVGQAAGMGFGKLLGAGGSALAKAGASKAEQVASETASQAALDEQSRIADEFGAVKPGAASVGDAIATAKGLGLENPTAQDLDSIGKIYTNGDINTNGGGVLNTYKNQVLQQAGGTVDLSDVIPNLKTTLASGKNPLLLGDMEPTTVGRGTLPVAPNNVATNMVSQLRAIIPGDEVGGTGAEGEFTKLGSRVAPTDGQTILKAVGDKINETTPMPNSAGVLDKADVAENNAWRTVYRNIRQSLYNRPEVNDFLKNTTVTPEMSSQIDDVIKAYGSDLPVEVQGNIKQDLIDTINNGSKMDDILDKESPMVNTGQVGKIQTEAEAKNPQTIKASKAIKSQINNQAPKNPASLGNVLNIGGGYEALVKGHPAAMLPALVYDVMKNPAAMQGVGNMIGKLGSTAGMAGIGALGNVVAGSPNDATNGAASGNMIDTGALSSMQSSPYVESLETALSRPFMPGASSTINALLPTVQKIAAANAAEQGLAQYFNTAGGAQDPIGGTLAKLGSLFTGAPAGGYGAQAAQAGQTIANALGVPASEVATPQITQNQTAAQAAINNIQNLIQSLQLGSQTGVFSQ